MNSVMCLVKHLSKYLSLCVGLLVINGCIVSNPTAEPANLESTQSVDDNRAESVVAQDFVNIMVQIERLTPKSTVLRFGPEEGSPSEIDARSIESDNAFGRALRVTAADSGYEIETVDGPGAENFVSFSIAEFGDAVDGTTYTYDVSVGEIDFRRVYKPLENGDVEPFQSMLVRGADVRELETDDSIFVKRSGSKSSLAQASSNKPATAVPTTAVSVAKKDRQLSSPSPDSTNDAPERVAKKETSTKKLPVTPILERPVTVAAPLISELPETGFENSTQKSGTVAESLAGDKLATGFETIRKINIAITGQSNYESLLADKKNVAEEILIFGDDSYVLGVRNKQILGEMMGEFNPETDVISVVGCSTGVTKIANGNAALAIGRANRVKEALLYSGIPHDKIYDEGCWSPQANSTPFPNRGVVVTVKRNAENG